LINRPIDKGGRCNIVGKGSIKGKRDILGWERVWRRRGRKGGELGLKWEGYAGAYYLEVEFF